MNPTPSDDITFSQQGSERRSIRLASQSSKRDESSEDQKNEEYVEKGEESDSTSPEEKERAQIEDTHSEDAERLFVRRKQPLQFMVLSSRSEKLEDLINVSNLFLFFVFCVFCPSHFNFERDMVVNVLTLGEEE